MELFPFQLDTVNKLKDTSGSLIAHDMGLGKTVTAIALDIEKRKKFEYPARTLVICPLSVISSWERHFRLWAPHLKVLAIHNKNRKPFMEAMEATFEDPTAFRYDVFIMHYPAVRLEPMVARYPWFHIICDEVHALQDKDSIQTKAVKKIKGFYKTGLSGTPIFNKPDDLWSILNWLYPKYWTSYWRYFKRYVKWVEWDGYRTVIGVNNEEELQNIMAGFYSRVKKEEVFSDLPEKYFSTRYVQLNPKQAKAYKQMKRDMLAWIGEHEHEPVNAPIVVAQLMRLQQFASAYAEIIRETKIKRNCIECKNTANQILELGLRDELETLIKIKNDGCLGHQVETIRLTDPSTKIDAVMEIIKESETPVVVFSQFSQMIELLGKRLADAGISHGLYTGSVPKSERDQIVDDFQDGKLKVFAGTIKAGGVGLTLTAASTVVILNREWAQSLNEQCIDRLHRIGQKNAVHVIDIVAEDTIDIERNLNIAMSWSVVKQLLGEN